MYFDDTDGSVELCTDEQFVVESSATMNIQLESIPHDGLVISVWDPHALGGVGDFIRQGCVDPQGTLSLEGYLDHTDEILRLQNLVNDFEAANIRRQGEIEKLRAEVENLIKNSEVQMNIKRGQLKAKDEELQQLRKTRKDKIVDYSLVDPDLLHEYAVMSLTGDYNTYDHGSELEELQERIEEDATFHPHVQQQIVTDDQGRKRFRKNVLVDRLVEECGINYAFGITASREDRAQLAQLIGYSVDGYQSLDYALPLEGEDE